MLLIDKATFPREKSCGGGLTAKVLDEFPYIKKHHLIESYSYGGYVYANTITNKVEIKRETPIMATVLRKKFDEGLIQLVVDQGCTFLERKKVTDINFSKNLVETQLETGESIESKVVIGADGVWSLTRKKAGLDPPRKQFAISLFNEYCVDERTIDHYFSTKRYGHLHLKLNGLAGYGWVFPKKNHINIGIGEMKSYQSAKNNDLKSIFQAYIHLLKQHHIIPDEITADTVRGAVLPIQPIPRTYGDNVLLCGDAAGLINPITGEGIHYAMDSGRIAANVIHHSLEKERTNKRFLSAYEKQWKRSFGKDIRLFLRVANQWEKTDFRYFELLKHDEKLKDMFLEIMMGNKSAHAYKYKIVKRMLYVKTTEGKRKRKTVSY